MSIAGSFSGSSPQNNGPARIIYFGRRCELSRVPLMTLIEQNIRVAAVFIPTPAPFGSTVRRLGTRSTIRLGTEPTGPSPCSVDDVVREHGIPLYGLRKPCGHELRTLLADIDPSLIVVSCFPWRIPSNITSVSKLVAINLHPSPLPEFRGPDPLFWAFHEGRRKWAVSVHRMTESLDAGPLLGQADLLIPDEIPGNVFESLVARRGGEVLASVVAALLTRRARETEQDEAAASYQSFPTSPDLLVDPNWPVQRALNFVAGVIPLGYSPLVQTRRGTFHLQTAKARTDTFMSPETWIGDNRVVIKLVDGVLDIQVGSRLTDG